MANLRLINKGEIREPKIRKKVVGTVISYIVSAYDMRIDKDLIQEILYGFGLGPNQEIIHRVLFPGNRVVYLTQKGLDDLLA